MEPHEPPAPMTMSSPPILLRDPKVSTLVTLQAPTSTSTPAHVSLIIACPCCSNLVQVQLETGVTVRMNEVSQVPVLPAVPTTDLPAVLPSMEPAQPAPNDATASESLPLPSNPGVVPQSYQEGGA